jgi:hypothetical protein
MKPALLNHFALMAKLGFQNVASRFEAGKNHAASPTLNSASGFSKLVNVFG